jgi:predicted PurR-regulated permease PerM
MVSNISLQQVNRFLFCGVLICTVLYFAQPILIPITFAIFFAMLLTPLCNRLEKRLKRGFAVFISVFLILFVILVIGTLVFIQSRNLAEKSEEMEKRSKELVHKAQGFISEKLNVTHEKQNEVISKKIQEAKESSGRVIKVFVQGFAGILAMLVMVLIFTFLFLFQREKYEAFFVQITGSETKPDEARLMVHSIASVAQNYLIGRCISISIFTILFTSGYLIVGLEGAFLLGLVGALLTLIPYLGSILAGLFPCAIAMVTSGPDKALAVIIVNLIINMLDNYLIEPNVIGGQVKISAFFTILILIIGGHLWGLAGMVLFLPLLGVTKIIFDSVPNLKPYAFLIGDQTDQRPAEFIKKTLMNLFGRKSKK